MRICFCIDSEKNPSSNISYIRYILISYMLIVSQYYISNIFSIKSMLTSIFSFFSVCVCVCVFVFNKQHAIGM